MAKKRKNSRAGRFSQLIKGRDKFGLASRGVAHYYLVEHDRRGTRLGEQAKGRYRLEPNGSVRKL